MAKKTYDEINRVTVPNPDGGWRPSPEQVKQAHEGFRALDADEQQLEARVRAALGGVQGVAVEVSRDRVTLRGSVSAEDLVRVPDLVRAVDGVAGVDDQLVSI
ncbi:MAG: BON domain-containing protein [Kofleriaceae bacterium]